MPSGESRKWSDVESTEAFTLRQFLKQQEHNVNPQTPGCGSSTASHDSKRLSLIPLVVLVYYGVSGGPFGVEAAVGAGGSLLSLISFVVLPFVWAIPEAMVTAELSTAFPEAAGFVAWVESAFGPFAGFMEGYMSWVSGVTDNSVYPVLFMEYVTASYPGLDDPHYKLPAILILVFTNIYLNYRGLEVVGNIAIFICLFSLAPFVMMVVLGLPKIDFSRMVLPPTGGWSAVDYPTFLNIMFWNFNYWDSAASFAGDTVDPGVTFPKAMVWALLLVVAAYVIPIMVGIGVTTGPIRDWKDGYFTVVGEEVGGYFLMSWILIAAAVSNMGMFQAELSSDSYQVMGMAQRGMLPSRFASRSRHGTPTAAILLSACGIILLSMVDFHSIIEMLNFLYCVAQLLEFASFLKLRWSKPDLHRPFQIPFGFFGCVLLLLPACTLIVLLMSMASSMTIYVCGTMIVFGVFLYFFLDLLKKHTSVDFCKDRFAYTNAELSPLLVTGDTPLIYTRYSTSSNPSTHPDIYLIGKRGRSPVCDHLVV